jgi:hypothetical protein
LTNVCSPREAALFFTPNSLNQGFRPMVARAHPFVNETGISHDVVTVVNSVIMGRVLRGGFTTL